MVNEFSMSSINASLSNPLALRSGDAYFYEDTLLGGKARNLAWLSKQANTVIPEWFVVTTEGFKQHIQQEGVHTAIERIVVSKDLGEMQGPLSEIREKIISLQMPAAISKTIEEQWRSLAEDESCFFAVRSSMVGEDAAAASFAGQMDTFLFQKGIDQVIEAVKRCFASAFSDRAIAYRIQKQLPTEDIRGAVIVQKMIEGEVSGVLFTANPNNGSRREALVSACYGIGEGVVSGQCTTDEFTVDLLEGNLLSSQINEKEEHIVFDKKTGSGVTQISVELTKQKRPCLTPDQLKELVKNGFQIAKSLSRPQDIEWTFSQGKLHILQTRPITSLPYPSERRGKRLVWDNSNIEESYCGATTPLTLSFARNAYETVYKQTMRALGFSEKIVQSELDTFRHLVAFIHGRTYYNINNWYRSFLYLPSLQSNKEDLEGMMGLQDPVDFIEDTELTLLEKVKKLPFLMINLLRVLREFSRMQSQVSRFQGNFRSEYKKIQRPLLQTLQLSELHALTLQLKGNLLEKWEVPIYNDFYVMMMNGKVRRTLEKAKIEEATALQNNLVSGEEGIESTEPTKVLLALADKVREKGEVLIGIFENLPEEKLLPYLETMYPEIHQDCLDYIELFGDRCIGEQKFETISIRQNSAFIFSVVKNFLKNPN